MRIVYIADTDVFVWCGGPDNDRFRRLRRVLCQADVDLLVPQRVYEELGGDPTNQIKYRSASENYLETISASELQ